MIKEIVSSVASMTIVLGTLVACKGSAFNNDDKEFPNPKAVDPAPTLSIPAIDGGMNNTSNKRQGDICSSNLQCIELLLCINKKCQEPDALRLKDDGEVCSGLDCKGYCVGGKCQKSTPTSPTVAAPPREDGELHRITYGSVYMSGEMMCQMFHYSNDLHANPWEFCMNVHNRCKTICPDANRGSWLCSHDCQ